MGFTVVRGDFLRIVALGGAGLTLGLQLPPANGAAAASTGGFSPVAWLRLTSDGLTTVVINQVEMGQGITTALSMCVAEELDVPMSRIRFELSPTEPKYYNPVRHGMGTGGSQSTPTMSPVMRTAGATARAMLVSAAAQMWGVDPAACTTADGVVSGPGGHTAAYTDLLVSAASFPVPATVALKEPGTFKILGTRQPRLDAAPKTNGSAIFATDVRVPGMKYASIERPVQIGAKLASFDAAAALKFPGVRTVIAVPSGIAVIADNTWATFQGRKLLHVVWAPGANAGVSTASIYATMRTLSRTPGGVLKSTGDVSSPLTGTVVQASYETPYLAHATMEPMNATADVHPDRVTLWAPTQAQTNAQAVAARIAGVPIAAVTLIPTYIGGGFGRRGESDYVADAVEVSKAAGLPIQLVWTREDDIRYDTFRPGSVAALTASLAPGGRISTLKQTLVSPSITARLAPSRMKDGVDPAAGNGLTNLAYAIPNQLVDWHRLDVAIPVGDWRAPYANSNTFVIESFIDELAHAANEDPVAFRLAMLDAGSRPHVVLERVAKLAHWGSSMPAGHARGVAIGQWNGSWIAIVAEVSKRASGLRVEQMLASVDVGQPINIDGLEQQLESAMSFGLSAALTGKITFADGGAVEKNFIDYPVLRMVDSPKFVCDIVPSTAKSSGAGEIGVPCVAPALANAMFALDGIRIRTLPLTANS